MKKIITIICSILIMLSLCSDIYAENGEITINSVSGNETSVSVSGNVDRNITAVVIEVVDESDQILSMQTVEVVDKTFSVSNIYANLNVGSEYTIKVADYDFGKWTKKKFTATEDPTTTKKDKSSKKNTVIETVKPIVVTHISTNNELEITPIVKEFKAEEYANVKESTVHVSNSQAIIEAAKEIADDLSTLTKNSKLPNYINETEAGALYKAIAAGKKFTIEIETNIIEFNTIKQDSEKIQTYVNKIAKDTNSTVQLYLDLKVYLLANNEKIATINKLNSNIEFAVALDESTLNNFENKYTYVVCLHDDNTTYEEATLKGNIVYFKADKFSTYGVFTTDSKIITENTIEDKEENVNIEEIVEEVNTEEKTNVGLYIGIGVVIVACAGIIIVLIKRKRA